MQIPGGSSPLPSALRAARAYGITPRPPAAAPATPAGMAPSQAEQLRSVLTDEERAYFDQIAALGQITYARGGHAGLTPDAPRGLRLDVTG
ncbi:MAG: hypothetical protein IPI92_06065 [Gemmatimonadetes bacterium]|nr:hypothetical protein [Gemmatimonadota bacterium]MBK9693067.1 hypothetical protein [Gemmatimonadota bacterium]